jgi:hypothetical protein
MVQKHSGAAAGHTAGDNVQRTKPVTCAPQRRVLLRPKRGYVCQHPGLLSPWVLVPYAILESLFLPHQPLTRDWLPLGRVLVAPNGVDADMWRKELDFWNLPTEDTQPTLAAVQKQLPEVAESIRAWAKHAQAETLRENQRLLAQVVQAHGAVIDHACEVFSSQVVAALASSTLPHPFSKLFYFLL